MPLRLPSAETLGVVPVKPILLGDWETGTVLNAALATVKAFT